MQGDARLGNCRRGSAGSLVPRAQQTTAELAAAAQHLPADDLARRTIERRAVEAVAWGMPTVNYDLMYQAMVRDAKGAPNQIVYWSRLPDWKNQTLTTNPGPDHGKGGSFFDMLARFLDSEVIDQPMSIGAA